MNDTLNRREILAGAAAVCLTPVLPTFPESTGLKTIVVEKRVDLIEHLLGYPFEKITEFDYHAEDPVLEIALASGIRFVHQGTGRLAQGDDPHVITVEGDPQGVKALGELIVMEWLLRTGSNPIAVEAFAEVWRDEHDGKVTMPRASGGEVVHLAARRTERDGTHVFENLAFEYTLVGSRGNSFHGFLTLK